MGSKSTDRRRFLYDGALAVGVLTLPAVPFAQQAAGQIAPAQIAPGLGLIASEANGLVFSTPNGAILIDAPPLATGPAEHYESARLLINTNWRPEHTAANEDLGQAGVRMLAHENTRLWMTNDFTVTWEDRRYRPRAAHALPTDTFYTTGQIEAGDEVIEYGHLARAHTDGDIYVFFRRANVLVVSDLLAVDRYPVIDYSTGGWVGGLIEASEAILELADADTLIVPAVGAPQSRTAVEAQLELCHAAREAVGKAFTQARSLEEMLADAPLAGWVEERGDPTLFLQMAYRGSLNHIRDLGLSIV